ncbi:unnamed protein product [Rotaria socialis]
MYQLALLMLVFVPLTSSLAIYDQCGGEGYRGSTYCNWPLQCFQRSRWYSSCQMSCPGGDWECARTGGSNGRGALAWEQCGGDGWNGPRWCTEYPCRARSVWYSQCRPDCPDGWLCTGKPTSIAPVISTIGSTSSMPIITGSTSTMPIITGSTSTIPIITGSTTSSMPIITGSTSSMPIITGSTTSSMPIITGSTSSMPIITGSTTSSMPIITGSKTSTPSTTETTFTMPTITLEP